jgi:hypothetical protein
MGVQINSITTTLYIPKPTNDKLLDYMRSHIGSTRGRNSVIVKALEEFLERKLQTQPRANNQNNNSHSSTSEPVGDFQHRVDDGTRSPAVSTGDLEKTTES